MSRNLKCIVIDDEPLGREIIEDFVKQVPNLELVNSFGNPVQALDFLQKNMVDIVFSDIEMPNLNGISLSNIFTNSPAFIFVTAHQDYALDGFETGAVDYLIKPVRFERFLKSVNRVRDQLNNAKTLYETNRPDTIFIKTGGKLVKIVLNDILYVEAQDDYLNIVTASGTYSTLSTLKSMESILSVPEFFRVQRSFIIRISEIKALESNTVEMKDGKVISVAIGKKDELFELLGLK